MKTHEGVIATLMELLSRLLLGSSVPNKVGAVLWVFRPTPPAEIYIVEYFTDGNKARPSSWSERKKVTPELFERMRRRGFLRGKYITPGCFSDWEFFASPRGEQTFHALEKLSREILEKLTKAENMRLCDFLGDGTSFVSEEVQDALDHLVSENHVESYEQEKQKYYRRVLQNAAA